MNGSIQTKQDEWLYPYGSRARYHFHHAHLFALNIENTINFYREWFDAVVAYDGLYANVRNVFLKIGIGAIHLYDQAPRDLSRNAIHHLGIQVVGLDDLYDRMEQRGLYLPNPIRRSYGGGYFMVSAPDNVLLELFEPGPERSPQVLAYYGYS